MMGICLALPSRKVTTFFRRGTVAAGDAGQGYTSKLGPNSTARSQREVASGLAVLHPRYTKDRAFPGVRSCS